MNKNVLKYLNEKELGDVGKNQLYNADEFLYSNTDIMSYYGRGNSFKIKDVQDFYEVIKFVKDLTDKHLFVKNVVWNANIVNNSLIIKFSINKDNSNDVNNFFLNSINRYIVVQIEKRFPKKYKVTSKMKDRNDNIMITITIDVLG